MIVKMLLQGATTTDMKGFLQSYRIGGNLMQLLSSQFLTIAKKSFIKMGGGVRVQACSLVLFVLSQHVIPKKSWQKWISPRSSCS